MDYAGSELLYMKCDCHPIWVAVLHICLHNDTPAQNPALLSHRPAILTLVLPPVIPVAELDVIPVALMPVREPCCPLCDIIDPVLSI